jgi:ring-1,2-phenylacetyl-CoA epoxidase subunit PaaE
LFTEESGKRVDIAYLKAKITDLTNREVYICGPIPMIKDLDAALKEIGINEKYIHYEMFIL